MAREYLESPFTPQISSELGGKSRTCQFIISNYDSRVILILEKLRLIGYFPIIAILLLVGCAKPDPAIFRYALQKTNMTPAELLHVRDSLELDVK